MLFMSNVFLARSGCEYPTGRRNWTTQMTGIVEGLGGKGREDGKTGACCSLTYRIEQESQGAFVLLKHRLARTAAVRRDRAAGNGSAKT